MVVEKVAQWSSARRLAGKLLPGNNGIRHADLLPGYRSWGRESDKC